MPVTPTYPGVYIEEIPSGVRTITGVATSIAAFIDFFKRGPMNKAVQILNMGDFERQFGGLDSRSEASYGIQQFFLNGGTEAWVVRVASGSVAAARVEISNATNGGATLTIEAGSGKYANPGEWGNSLRVQIDYPSPVSGGRFNMSVSQVENQGGQEVVLRSEVFRGLSLDTGDASFVDKVINDEFSGSKLVRITGTTGNAMPLQTGTVSGNLNPFPTTITFSDPQVSVTIGTEGTGVARLGAKPTSLAEARKLLESAIRSARPEIKAFSQASVSIIDDRLRILAGPGKTSAQVAFGAAGTDTTVSVLGLSAGTTLSGVISGDITSPVAAGKLNIKIGASSATLDLNTPMPTIESARQQLETKIRAATASPADQPAFAGARVIAYSDAGKDRLIVVAGVPNTPVSFTKEAADPTIDNLSLGAAATSTTAFLSIPLAPPPAISSGSKVNLTIGSVGPQSVEITSPATTLATIVAALQAAIRSASPSPAFATARVSSSTDNRLVILPGVAAAVVSFSAAPLDATTVEELKLTVAKGATSNLQAYRLGDPSITDTAQAGGLPGDGGSPPNALAIIGDFSAKTGLNALEDADLFNILCIPRASMVTGQDKMTKTESATVIAVASAYCERRRAFFVVDTPSDVDEVEEIKSWLEQNATLRHKNTALYFPRVQVGDPLDGFRLKSVGASGTVAGLYARTDANRGVWKAPAGIDATLANVQKYDYLLTDGENGVLNPLGINCLRNFKVFGNVSWGARTLVGADQQGSEWKYVPVRRVALFLEESLYRGTQFAVFEPNDEPLWAQIRLNVGAFLHNLFRQGAFQGKTPRDAYFVKCDKETTTQNDINLGIVNIMVGFAPLKPAEFVIIKLQQMAGQIET